MDLENFDDQGISQSPPSPDRKLSVAEIVEVIDDQWYRPAARRGRWMDLISDYAGREPFVVDGDALFECVLDDPLLSIGKSKGASFQILHAFYSLEYTLLQFKRRFAEIDIVFWRSTREAVIVAHESSFTISSRLLAYQYLREHIKKLGFPLYEFEGLQDPEWKDYFASRKPILVMTNDGGLHSGRQKHAIPAVLLRRLHICKLLSSKIPIALLKEAEYRDSKILTFILESAPSSLQLSDLIPAFTAMAQDSLSARVAHCVKLVSANNVNSRSAGLRAVVYSYPSRLAPELLYIFALHCLLVPSLSVHERARRHHELHPKLERLLVDKFFPFVFFTLASTFSPNLSEIDGEVFRSLLVLAIDDPSLSVFGRLDITTQSLLFDIHSRFKLNFHVFAANYPSRPNASPSLDESVPYQLLPFENRVFNSDVLDITLPTQANDDELSLPIPKLSHGTSFLDTHHWHSHHMILPSHLGGETTRPENERHRRKLLKGNQRFMANMQSQAATLTGAAGNILEQMVIPPVSSGRTNRAVGDPQLKSKNTYKGKPKGPSAADKRRKQIADEKSARELTESEHWWEERLSSISKQPVSSQISSMELLLRNKRSQQASIGLEMQLYRLHLELQSWIEDDQRDSDEARDIYTVSIMRMIKSVAEEDRWTITKAAAKALNATLKSLGFYDSLSDWIQPNEELTKGYRFQFVKLVSSRTGEPHHSFMRIKEHPIIWQLRLFGEYMDRSMDSAPDPRVSFQPDAWQREVLDCIDSNQSVLVVAPTSAGKTFISYYAMEQVLRASDDGVLVYVAPTKALVTQIAAEVYARFRKTVNGKTCWAIHTRDWRINDPQKCQILVTVPEVLAIMLLSPVLARVWTPRIKRIILDEIHSIGQHEGGAVWEQILLLAPCPIIGLSATIGSPERFNEWLEYIQKAHNFQHRFIQWPHRYSHLRKFFYTLNEEPLQSFKDLSSHLLSGRIRFLHPISLLSFGARTLPPDLALEPRDTLSLYQALSLEDDLLSLTQDSVDPISFFSTVNGLLRQKNILDYEAKLKVIVSAAINKKDNQVTSAFARVVGRLEDSNLRANKQLSTFLPSKDSFKENLIHLLADLHSLGELPAIIFNFDRTECEVMAVTLVNSLREAEEHHRETDKIWQGKIREWEKWKLLSKERERQAERIKKQKPNQEEAPSTASVPWQSIFDPSLPSAEFSFAGLRSGYSMAELRDEVKQLERWTSTEKWALAALERGIAVHHAGMNKRYRSLVESLFRNGFLRVIIATGTLALGINAPAKTCVFAGDSPYLTALMYRQCSGRAGRRGYDLLGNVIFYGITYDRVQRLILSNLPMLGGSFPITSTMTMRLLNLLEGSDYAPYAENAVRSILSMSQVGFGSYIGRQQLSHHVRFSVELLRRSRLIDSAGKPVNLFAVAAHLYYTEPSNFLLVTLLQHGALHAICKTGDLDVAQRQFILIMSHLFGRRYLPRVQGSKEYHTRMSKRYPSMIMLPPLPKPALKILNAYNDLVLRSSAGYMIAYANDRAESLGADDKLPLSRISYAGDGAGTHTLLRSNLAETALELSARSAFVANSGHDDTFKSVNELANTLRDGLYLHEHSIPFLDNSNSSLGNGSYLNAYLLDFFIHGQVSTLSIANGIRRGDVWYLLQDFMLTLKTVKSALEQLLLRASTAANGTTGTEDFSDPLEGESVTLVDDDEEEGSIEGDGLGIPGNSDKEASVIAKPKGVSESDWKVYEMVCGATDEFERKFKAIWA